jgi:dihydroflavonol-4-reductase
VYRIWLPDPDVIFRVNLEGTTATLLAAAKAGVKRIVYTSSIAAVGMHADGRPSDETVAYNLWDVSNDYILTKHLSERIAHKFASDGLPIVIVNPGFPFGPGDRAPTPTGKIILSILKGDLPGVTGGGFSAIDVDDCAKGHLLAEEKGRIGERYLLVNHNVTYRDFFALVGDVAQRKVINVTLPDAATSLYGLLAEKYADNISRKEPTATVRAMRYAQQNVFFDNTKARTELGLPSRPLRESIQRAIEFFKEIGYASLVVETSRTRRLAISPPTRAPTSIPISAATAAKSGAMTGKIALEIAATSAPRTRASTHAKAAPSSTPSAAHAAPRVDDTNDRASVRADVASVAMKSNPPPASSAAVTVLTDAFDRPADAMISRSLRGVHTVGVLASQRSDSYEGPIGSP